MTSSISQIGEVSLSLMPRHADELLNTNKNETAVHCCFVFLSAIMIGLANHGAVIVVSFWH